MIARLKSISKFAIFGIAMFSLGCIYEAILLITPRLAYMVLGQ